MLKVIHSGEPTELTHHPGSWCQWSGLPLGQHYKVTTSVHCPTSVHTHMTLDVARPQQTIMFLVRIGVWKSFLPLQAISTDPTLRGDSQYDTSIWALYRPRDLWLTSTEKEEIEDKLFMKRQFKQESKYAHVSNTKAFNTLGMFTRWYSTRAKRKRN